jgi:hypothetical protein
MDIKYREKMKESDVTLESDVLDPAFVSKANAFEEKLKNNQLTDEEITAADDELVALFNAHDLSEEDSDELKQAKQAKVVSDAKAEVSEAETTEALTALQEKFKELPEVLPLISKKLEKLQKQAEKIKKDDDQAKLEKFIADAKAEIKAAKFEELQAMGEKYKEYPELVTIINKRHKDEKPEQASKGLKEKLLSKSEWSYAELKELGITPTGNDMTVKGVKLEKEFLLNIYSVRK